MEAYSRESCNNGQAVKIPRVHDSMEDVQLSSGMENMYVFASPTEYGQYLAQSSKSEFERLTHTDKYDKYFINLGITKSSIQGGTQEENRMVRQRFMHALVGQLWMEGRIKIGRYQCMQDTKY